MKKALLILLTLALLLSAFPRSASADVAPPETVPGSNVNPGSGSTQVRMVAETVTLTISEDPADTHEAIAKTEAVFAMLNLGSTEEKMAVRFPLSFFDGTSGGWSLPSIPEIESIAVKVDGRTTPTSREMQPFMASEGPYSYPERDEIPWAVFEVDFPPNQVVNITVTYTVEGYGYYPYETFRYVLETGAGWNGTIDSAQIILRLPYEVNAKNVSLETVDGYSRSTAGGVISGNEIHWEFKDLEPTFESNLQVEVLSPSLWKSVLKETEAVTQNPNDGEAWGRLGKAYKEVITVGKGYLRSDAAGREMFELSKSAYEKCLALLPNDSLWHYGYADLLWSYYYFDLYWLGETDSQRILPKVLTELQTALALDPSNQQAREFLLGISNAIPEAVQVEGDSFVLLGLTATPVPPTPYPDEVTETPLPTSTPVPTQPATEVPTERPPERTAPNPLCGSLALVPAVFGTVWAVKRKGFLKL